MDTPSARATIEREHLEIEFIAALFKAGEAYGAGQGTVATNFILLRPSAQVGLLIATVNHRLPLSISGVERPDLTARLKDLLFKAHSVSPFGLGK